MTDLYADPDAHARWLVDHIASPLRATVRTDIELAHRTVATLRREDLEALALILAGASNPFLDLHRELRWLTDAVQPLHADEYYEAPRPLVVHRG